MRTILLTAFLGCSFFSISQTGSLNTTERTAHEIERPDAVERYKKDYELKDYVFNGDSTVLYKLNLDYLEQFRETSSKVEVTDPFTNLIVILYARKKRPSEDY